MNTFYGTDKDFENLINTYKSAVYSTAYTYLGYNFEVDDIVQETFIHAYFNYGIVKDKSKIGAWLCGVARNMSLKRLRSTRFTLSLEAADSIGGGDPENLLISKEDRLAVRRAINSLSKPIAEAVTLFYLAEKSIHEISLLLGVPEGTVKSRLHDGRKYLKGDLIKMMKDEGQVILKQGTTEKIKKYIETASEADEKGQFSVMLQNYSKAIDTVLANTASDHKKLAELYRLRASVLGYDREKKLADGQKSIECAKKSGDDRLTAECMLSYAFDTAIDEHPTTFGRAYNTANAIGYHEVCAESAFWIGMYHLYKLDYESAKEQFHNAIKHHKNINGDANICTGDSVRIGTFARAALRSISMIECEGKTDGNYSTLNIFCQLLRASGGKVISDNDYGWDVPGSQGWSNESWRFFGLFANNKLLISEEFESADSLDIEYYSCYGVLIKRTYTVISRSETLSVSGGTFENCIHIKITEEIPGYDPEDQNHAETASALETSEYWFAEMVGLVKTTVSFACGSPESHTAELCEYTVVDSHSAGTKYFPLAVGNKWEYVIFDNNGAAYSDKYGYRNIYEVDTISDDIVYIGNSGYLFTK